MVLISKPNVGQIFEEGSANISVEVSLIHLSKTVDFPALSSPLQNEKCISLTFWIDFVRLQNQNSILSLLNFLLSNDRSQSHYGRWKSKIPVRTYIMNNLRTSAAERLQKLLQPSKVVEYFRSDSSLIPFSLKNGTDHFTLPLQRIIFTYCPHNGDSKPLM